MSHEPFGTEAAAYALGALDASDRAAFEEHLAAGCADCAAALAAFEETLADLARGAPPVAPPPRVRADLMRRMPARSSRGTTARRRRLRRALITGLAVIGVAGFVGGLVASRYEARIGAMIRETARVRADLRREEIELRRRLTATHDVVDVLLDPASRVITLRGLGPGARAVGRVVWHDVNGGYLFAANVPPPPVGRIYAAWAITDGRPRPAGRLTRDAAGRITEPLARQSARVEHFVVTLEVDRPVATPTGPTVLTSTR